MGVVDASASVRRTVRRISTVVACAVAVGGGAYGVTRAMDARARGRDGAQDDEDGGTTSAGGIEGARDARGGGGGPRRGCERARSGRIRPWDGARRVGRKNSGAATRTATRGARARRSLVR